MTTLTIPTFDQKPVDKDVTNRVWYFFWQGLWKGTPPSSEIPVTPTASPYTYVATQRGFLIVNGGTVSAVALSRDGTTFYTTGATAGTFPLSNGDSIKITYAATPTLTFFSQ